MLSLIVRKIVVQVETILRTVDQPVEPATRKVVAAAVIHNPFAGRFVEDLSPMYQLGADVGGLLVEQALAALDAPADTVTSYGKGAIVGVDGDIEHTAAILHPRFGAPIRARLGGGKAIIPGTKKIGGPGASITMPLCNVDDIWKFDDMDAAEIVLADAPRADEILVALCLGIGGRPRHRVGAAV
ncbi:MAG: amino acid synthesis family protein [Sphingomonas sp.]